MNSIGERIQGLRESKGLSAKELCSFLDINPSTYSKLENNKKSIDVEELRKITKYYDISADYILGIDDNQEDTILYMRKDKDLTNEDIEEVQMAISMMDEAVTQKIMLEGI